MRYRGRHTAAAMRRRSTSGARRRRLGTLGVASLALGAGLMVLALPPAWSGLSTAATLGAPTGTLPTFNGDAYAGLSGAEWPHTRQVADPRRLLIPTIDVAAEIVPLSLEPDRTLEVPKDFDASGWYVDGPEPGELGASVIIGHVDSYEGPAVFFRLEELMPGDPVTVVTAEATSVTFVVERVEQYPKAQFPTDVVYGATQEPTLRLITCGGVFDRSAGSYQDNVVVFARLLRAPTFEVRSGVNVN